MQISGDYVFVYMCVVALCILILYLASIWVITTLRRYMKIKRYTFIKSKMTVIALSIILILCLMGAIPTVLLYLKHYESILLLWTGRFAIVTWIVFFISASILIMNVMVFRSTAKFSVIIVGIAAISLVLSILVTIATIDTNWAFGVFVYFLGVCYLMAEECSIMKYREKISGEDVSIHDKSGFN